MGNPLVFSGRVRRTSYLLIAFAIGCFDFAAEQVEGGELGVLTLLSLLLIWPSIALAVQRAHDSGRSGTYLAKSIGWLMLGVVIIGMAVGSGLDALMLLGILPLLIGIVMSLILTFAAGDPGSNAYGDNPRQTAASTA